MKDITIYINESVNNIETIIKKYKLIETELTPELEKFYSKESAFEYEYGEFHIYKTENNELLSTIAKNLQGADWVTNDYGIGDRNEWMTYNKSICIQLNNIFKRWKGHKIKFKINDYKTYSRISAYWIDKNRYERFPLKYFGEIGIIEDNDHNYYLYFKTKYKDSMSFFIKLANHILSHRLHGDYGDYRDISY